MFQGTPAGALRLVVVLGIGAVSLASPSRARATCPADTLIDSTFTAASASLTRGSPPVVMEHAAYDLTTGTFSGSFGSVVDGSVLLLAANDVYTLTGPPPGTALTLVVEVRYAATVTGPAAIHIRAGGATLAGGADRTSSATDSLWVPIDVTAGQPFAVRYTLAARALSIGVSMSASASCSILFRGLPAGSAISSCRGFAESATPVTRVTWGSLKMHYR